MTNDELSALIAGYSKARLEVYLREVNADPDRAWQLIIWERRVAAALWTDISHCEVIVRNTIQQNLQRLAGHEDWYDRLPKLGIIGADRRRVDDAIQRLHDEHRTVTADRVTANLTFTFWTNLVSTTYDRTLWRNGLHRAFQSAPRRDVHAAMERVKALRNRIAHHDPLIKNTSTETAQSRLLVGPRATHQLIRWTASQSLADKVCTANTVGIIGEWPVSTGPKGS